MKVWKKLSQVSELWWGVFGLLIFITMVEVMHTTYHREAAPYCASVEAPQSRTSA